MTAHADKLIPASAPVFDVAAPFAIPRAPPETRAVPIARNLPSFGAVGLHLGPTCIAILKNPLLALSVPFAIVKNPGLAPIIPRPSRVIRLPKHTSHGFADLLLGNIGRVPSDEQGCLMVTDGTVLLLLVLHPKK